MPSKRSIASPPSTAARKHGRPPSKAKRPAHFPAFAGAFLAMLFLGALVGIGTFKEWWTPLPVDDHATQTTHDLPIHKKTPLPDVSVIDPSHQALKNQDTATPDQVPFPLDVPSTPSIASDEATPSSSQQEQQRNSSTPLPTWLHNALPPPAIQGRAMIAIVIDDMGVDEKRSANVIDLDGPITTSFLTYARHVKAQSRASRQHGHELLVHFPMEPQSRTVDPGPGVLKTSLSTAELAKRLDSGLARFDGYVGINNHMGSKFTAFAPGMEQVMLALKKRGLLWLDSRTTAKSVSLGLAANMGVPHAERHVFLDNKRSVPAILKQLAHTEKIARKRGYAIAIGHPHDSTINALKQWLPTLPSKGFVLVPLSTIVRTHTVSERTQE